MPKSYWTATNRSINAPRCQFGMRLVGPLSLGEREPEVSSVSVPVFGLNGPLLGSMCMSGSSSRLAKAKRERYARHVIRAANKLSYALAGCRSAATPPVVSNWHP